MLDCFYCMSKKKKKTKSKANKNMICCIFTSLLYELENNCPFPAHHDDTPRYCGYG